MDELRKTCGRIPAKHILIILDCCFSGVAALGGKTGYPSPTPEATDAIYLENATKWSAWQILTASARDEVAADSGSRPGHSAFTAALLDGLRGKADLDYNKIITASELYPYVRRRVVREANQTPFFNNIIGTQEGDFVFMLPGFNPGARIPQDINEIMQKKQYPDGISERLFLVHSWKRASSDDKEWYSVRVWLDAYDDSDLEDCTRVTYRLYDDFSKQVIASESKDKFFEIFLTIWGGIYCRCPC